MLHLTWWAAALNAATLLGVGLALGAVVERFLFRRKHVDGVNALGRIVGAPIRGDVTHSFQYPTGKGKVDLLNFIPSGDRVPLMELWRDAR